MKLIKKSVHVILAMAFLAFGLLLTAAPFGEESSSFIPFSFVPGTTAKAAEVNANFSAVEGAVKNLQAGAWTPSGGSVYRTTGNVGIGTSNPLAKLHVNGSVRFANGTVRLESLAQDNSHTLVVTADSSGNLAYRPYPSAPGGGVNSVLPAPGHGLFTNGSVDVTIGIEDGGVTTSKLAGSVVTEAKLANNAVTASKIASGAVTSTKIANDAILNTHVANNAITSNKIAADAVTNSNLVNNAVSNSKISDVSWAKVTGAPGFLTSNPTWNGNSSSTGAEIFRSGRVGIGISATPTRRLEVEDAGSGAATGWFKGTGTLSASVVGENYGDRGTAIWAYYQGTFAQPGAALRAVAVGNAYAGDFSGNVTVQGVLSKSSGTFKIDHPLDPENKYLYHSFVESPDMMNIYNGNVETDSTGQAWVELPEYFDALNRDFRYQLTVIGQFANAIIGEEIQDGRFSILTDKAFVKVSWQVTGVRQDPWAEANRVKVEVDKPEEQRGLYLNPDVYGMPPERGVRYRPDLHGASNEHAYGNGR